MHRLSARRFCALWLAVATLVPSLASTQTAPPALRSIVLAPASWTMGGTTIAATVTLTSVASAQGQVVALQATLSGSTTLSSGALTTTTSPTRTTTISSTSTPRTTSTTQIAPSTSMSLIPVTIPSSVTVPAGRMSVTFPVQVQLVSSEKKVTITAGTTPNTVSVILTVMTQEPKFIALRVDGPSFVPEGGTGTFTAFAEYDNGGSMNVTPYAYSWSVDNGAGSTIQNGVLKAPAQLTQPTHAVVRAVWGEPDGATRGGYKTVELRSWTVEIDGPAEVRESDFDNHMLSGAVQYTATIVRADGSRTQQSGASWSHKQVFGLSANIMPDGRFGVFNASSDLQTEIHVMYNVNGSTRAANKPIQIRYLPSKLTGLKILNAPDYVDIGATHQLTAQAQFRSGSPRVVPASWTLASAPTGTTINATTGAVTAGSTPGPVNVSASYTQDGITRATMWGLSIIAPVITGLDIIHPIPNTQLTTSMWEGTTRQYKAQLMYQDGRRADVQPQWSVSSPQVQISPTGFLTTSDIGSDVPVTVTARHTIGAQTYSRTNDVLVKANYPTSCEMLLNGVALPIYVQVGTSGGFNSVSLAAPSTTQFQFRVTMADGSTTLSPANGASWTMKGQWAASPPSDPAFADPPAVSISQGAVTIPSIPPSSSLTLISGEFTARFEHQGKSCTRKTEYTAK